MHLVERGVERLEGLAVDWLAGNVYWSDSSLRRIECGRVQNGQVTYRKVIVADNDQHGVNPHAIVIHPARGLVNLNCYSYN